MLPVTHYDHVVASIMDPPLAKKQRTAPAHKPSLLLDSYGDILENVYSFLALKEALVLRRVCRQLNNDTDIFRCSIIVDSNMVSRMAVPSSRHQRYLDRQERALCNLASAASLRALLANRTLPQDMIVNFLTKVTRKSLTDNGEAISVLLQDDRVLVEPAMLDKVLRRDFFAMAAALQQNEVVRAGIRMCDTCSVKVGAYQCLNGPKCACFAKKDKEEATGDANIPLPPKYCCACMRAKTTTNHQFCECGEYLCQDCVGAGNFSSCDACEEVACSREKCTLSACASCTKDFCSGCTSDDGLLCIPCWETEQYGYGSEASDSYESNAYNRYNDSYSDYYNRYGYSDGEW